jgi:hypothetical protein
MRTGSLFFGSLIVLVGIGLMVNNLFSIDVWPFLIPTALILLGVWFIVGPRLGGRSVASEEVTIPLEGASRAEVRIMHGAGRLTIHGRASAQTLATGLFTGGLDHREDRLGDTLRCEMKVPSDLWWNFGGPWITGTGSAINWDFRLSDEVPMTIDLKTGAGEAKVDLSTVNAQSINLETGASSFEMILPERAGRSRARVASGMASVSLRVPDGVAAKISVQSGLASISIDQNRFPRTESGYQSADYDRAENAVEIKVETGMGSVDIR